VPAARRLLDPIDHLLALDPGGRGIAAFFQKRDPKFTGE